MAHTNKYPRGAVFYVDLGEPDGTSRQAYCRPCVLISSEINNRMSPTLNIVAFSASKLKWNSTLPVHVRFTAAETGLAKDCVCLCEQPMTIAKTQLREYVTTLSSEQMELISEAIKLQLSL